MPPKTHTELIQELSNTVAAQAATISRLEDRLSAELRQSRETFQEQADGTGERIHQLATELRILQERDARREADAAERKAHDEKRLDEIAELRRELAAARQENAVLRQQLQDHVAQYQEWDRRRWGLIVLLIGTVFSLASGLIVTLAKK